MKKNLLQELVVDRAGLVWAYQFHDATTTELSHADDLGERLSQHLIDPAGKLVYNGAIDDKRSANPEDVKTSRNLLAAALDELRAGKPVSNAVNVPYGCTIKYK